jgi:hypothetical protein
MHHGIMFRNLARPIQMADVKITITKIHVGQQRIDRSGNIA